MNLKINSQGGVVPPDAGALARAKKVDLGTMPLAITGTSCENCEYFEDHSGGVGMCNQKSVMQPVSYRQCCCLWYPAQGKWIRPWEKK